MNTEIKEIIKDFITFLRKERGYSEHTVTSYNRDLVVFHDYLRSCFKDDEHILLKVDKACLRNFLGSEFENGLSARTVARRLATVKSLFKYLVKAEVIPHDPAQYVRTPKTPQKLPSFIQEPLIQQLMEYPDLRTLIGARDRAILELFYSTGMRLSELAGLDTGSFDTKRRTVRVIGKGNKERLIPYGKHAESALEHYFSLKEEKITSAKVRAPVFTSRKGKRLSISAIQKRVRYWIGLVAEGERIGPHILRHSFATHMMDQGADIRAVKDLLGHSSLSSTQVYTHLQPEKMKKIYKKAHPHGTR